MAKKKSKAGRKPIADKKVRLVFFLEESSIADNGGPEVCKDQCYLYLKERGQKIKKSSITNVH